MTDELQEEDKKTAETEVGRLHRGFTKVEKHCLTAGLLATGQYSEGPATGHLDTGFSWFPCAQKQILRLFPRFQVANTCFSCSPPDLNLVVTNFMFCLHVK